MNDQQNMHEFAKITNANFHYNEFLKAIETRNNKTIESTKVIEVLNRILSTENSHFKKTLDISHILFRCRVISPEDWDKPENGFSVKTNGEITGFDKFGSKEPPLGISSDARNNIKGASYLYLAEDEYTACAEVRPYNMDFVSIATFKVLKPLHLVNFSVDDKVSSLEHNDELLSISRLVTNLMQQFCLPVKDSSKYYVTQYIAEHIRKYGYDGLCYVSSASHGINYTIFNCSENNISFLSSKILRCQSIKYEVYDLNSKRVIHPPKSIEQLKLDDNDIERIRKTISNHISVNNA